MPFLPALFAWVAPAGVWFLRLLIVSVVAKIIVSAGIAVAVFVGFDILMDEATAIISNQFAGLPAEVAGFVGLLELDTACTIILSAYSWRITFLTLRSMKLVRIAGGD